MSAARLPASPDAAAAPPSSSRPTPLRVAVVQTTANLSDALTELPSIPFTGDRPHLPLITVDDTVRYQRMIGFGGAMTDTSAWLLYDELSPAQRALAMDRLFGPGGIRLELRPDPDGRLGFHRERRAVHI